VHADAPSAKHTDWAQIVALYDQLRDLADTPVVVMNRAIALAEVAGPAEALAELDGLDLGGYHLFQATRGDLLARLGRQREAADAFAQAVDLTSNAAERALLARRRDDAMAAHHRGGASN
jgi:RNA polymerase sigma-70 factor (ECF subfamily)